MTADDVRGEDYEAAKPTATRTLVTGDPWQNRNGSVTHLPECPWPNRRKIKGSVRCICPALRACEQRVLRAACDAVVAVPNVVDVFRSAYVNRFDALAAIDALLTPDSGLREDGTRVGEAVYEADHA